MNQINDLLKRAAGFSLSVRLSGLRQVFVRGLRIGNGAALFLRAQERYGAKETVGSKLDAALSKTQDAATKAKADADKTAADAQKKLNGQ